jgi:hypothetical protein
MYVSHLIQYAKAFLQQELFKARTTTHQKELLLQDYSESLKSSFYKFHSRYNDVFWDYNHDRVASWMIVSYSVLDCCFHIGFDDELFLALTKGPRWV